MSYDYEQHIHAPNKKAYESRTAVCPDTVEEEMVSAEIALKFESAEISYADIEASLDQVNSELDRYTSHADAADYAFAVASGIMAGAIDALIIGESMISENDIGLSHKQVNHFIESYAKSRGIDGEHLKDFIAGLEKKFVVAQDNIWKGEGIGVAARNHHLADLAHHPTPVGLASAIIVQFLRFGTFVNRDGEWNFKLVDTNVKDILQSVGPAVMTGMLNWLVAVSEKKLVDEDEHVPEALERLIKLVASTPMIIEVAKCADNWFGHLVSDMGGSKNTPGGGMGIPGLFISFLYELAALPLLKDSCLPNFVNDLYQNKKLDLRHELPVYKNLGKQAIPVLFIELYTRMGYFIGHLCSELKEHKNFHGVNWKNTIPVGNRTVDRMLTVANMTFTMADTADAAVHAALESGGNWVLFSGKFVTRFNYVGAGRAVLSVVKEISDEKRESELIREKLILTAVKTEFVIQQLEQYKAELEQRMSEYLAEDIESFLNGFDTIRQGLNTGNSNLVILGNVKIQRVLGREPQFSNQQEFDDLMESDIPLIL